MNNDHEIAEFIVQLLLRKKDHREFLSVLGNAIPEQPTGGLKKLFLRNPGQFILIEREDGTCIVQIKNPESLTINPTALPHVIDYDELEKNIVLFMLDHGSKSDQPLSLPCLGEFCKLVLGIDMKHKLFKFLSDRSHIFVMPDTGRQHVVLASGACEKVGIQKQLLLPKFPETISEFHDSARQARTNEGTDMDDIAAEIHEMLSKAGGILSIADIEREMKTMKAAVINASGIDDEEQWHAGSIAYKYPHVFHRRHQYLALVEYVKPGNLLDSPHHVDPDDFPPLK